MVHSRRSCCRGGAFSAVACREGWSLSERGQKWRRGSRGEVLWPWSKSGRRYSVDTKGGEDIRNPDDEKDALQ